MKKSRSQTRRIKCCLALILVLSVLIPIQTWAAADSGSELHWQDYNGKRIGVLVGPLMEDIAHTYFPDSEYLLLNSYPDCIAALLAGKIDAYLGDEPGLKSVHAEQPRIDYIHDRITNQDYSFAFRKNDPESAALCEELNTFLAINREDGTMQELDDIWFGVDEERKVVGMSDLSGENGTIRVVTTSEDMPWSYIKDGKNVGYDIDLVVRFCRYAGYKLELGDVDFAARIPAIQSGKYDFTTDMNVTPERKEQVLFSNPTSSGGVVLAILNDNAKASAQSGVYSSLLTMDGARIGVATGTVFDAIVLETLPNAEVVYINSSADLIAALEAGKIDGFAVDEPAARQFCAENKRLTVMDEHLDDFEFGFVLPLTDTGDALLGELDEWLASQKESGALEQIVAKWVEGPEEEKDLPDYVTFPAQKDVLTLATEGDYVPLNYFRGNEIVGMEIDLAAQFCEANGYGLTVQAMNFDGILPAVQAGKADFAAAGISITDERRESVHFSMPYFTGSTVMVVLKDAKNPGTQTEDKTSIQVDDLAGKRIGVVTGSIHDSLVSKRLPSAQIMYFTGFSDLSAALKAGKIDAFACIGSIATFMQYEDESLTWPDEHLLDGDLAFAFAKSEKGQALNKQFSEYIRTIRSDGTLDTLREKWFSVDEANKTIVDYSSLPETTGTLHMATAATQFPFSYVRDGNIVGFEIELAARFCAENGYRLQVEQMNFDGVLASVQTGKCDFAGSCLAITEERRETVDFSEPYYAEGVVLVTHRKTVQDKEPTLLDNVLSSFNKTFIRENRWKLFVEGIGTTMLITILSILFGTALGFLTFLWCRNGNPFANAVTRFCLWLVQGMPMVVLLMILYYVIFGSTTISGLAVAVIGFTLTFGAAVFGMLKMGVGVVDRGQYEAAYALGHSNRHTFFIIILPQAIPHVLPAYQGEIVGLIKATAIVGYIAVQDLTKMGDIVRSRTYEAFFPLIAITVIYFVLEGLLSLLVSRIRIQMNPKKRSREHILKGVNLHD